MKLFNSIISIKIILIVLLLAISQSIYSKNNQPDTVPTKSSKILIKQAIIPISLIGAGLIFSNGEFEQNFQTKLRNKVGNTYAFHIDEYAQYVPVAELYIANLTGIKSKNHWFDQTKYLVISNIVSGSLTFGLNHLTHKTGPNDEELSFPSGHTTFAFTNATVLFNEFQQTAPVLAYSGYAFATTTGAFRMINNKHWLSDVLVGAGIGMLATHLVYYFEPFKNFNPFMKSKNISLIPTINSNNIGLYFSLNFK